MKKLISITLLSSLLLGYIGEVIYIKGKAIVIDKDKNKTLLLHSPIDINQTIITFSNSKLKLKFKDNTLITLGQNSKFKVLEYKFDKNSNKAKFKFFKGVFRSITGQIGKFAPKRFKLLTTNASIGIRGTIVLGKITHKGSLIVCEKGAISVTSLTTKVTKLLKAGEGVIVTTTISNIFKVSNIIIKNLFNSVLNLIPTSNQRNKNNKYTVSNKIKHTTKIINKINDINNTKQELNWTEYTIDNVQPTPKKEKILILDEEIKEKIFRIK